MSWDQRVQDRFWSHVRIRGAGESPCWVWISTLNHRGYGRFHLGGKRYQAHRFAYESMVGEIPVELRLDHLCRVKHCVRPDHLEPVTIRENSLRGDHPRYVAYRTNTCLRGHSLVDAPVRKDGTRRCRTCCALRERERRLSQAA